MVKQAQAAASRAGLSDEQAQEKPDDEAEPDDAGSEYRNFKYERNSGASDSADGKPVRALDNIDVGGPPESDDLEEPPQSLRRVKTLLER